MFIHSYFSRYTEPADTGSVYTLTLSARKKIALEAFNLLMGVNPTLFTINLTKENFPFIHLCTKLRERYDLLHTRNSSALDKAMYVIEHLPLLLSDGLEESVQKDLEAVINKENILLKTDEFAYINTNYKSDLDKLDILGIYNNSEPDKFSINTITWCDELVCNHYVAIEEERKMMKDLHAAITEETVTSAEQICSVVKNLKLEDWALVSLIQFVLEQEVCNISNLIEKMEEKFYG